MGVTESDTPWEVGLTTCSNATLTTSKSSQHTQNLMHKVRNSPPPKCPQKLKGIQNDNLCFFLSISICPPPLKVEEKALTLLPLYFLDMV